MGMGRFGGAAARLAGARRICEAVWLRGLAGGAFSQGRARTKHGISQARGGGF